jgi:hypothetical protein
MTQASAQESALTPLVRLVDVHKSFGATEVLRGISMVNRSIALAYIPAPLAGRLRGRDPRRTPARATRRARAPSGERMRAS